MEHNETDLPIGAKVELLPGCDELYNRAVAGSRAFVQERKLDDYGFPLVYVEWDREHWRYNDEPDGWTFATHFRVIEAPDPDAPVKDDACPHCGEGHTEIPPAVRARAEDYVEQLHAAFEEAVDSDGFFIVTFKQETDVVPGYTTVMPFWHAAYLTDDVRSVLESQLVYLAQLAEQRIRREGR